MISAIAVAIVRARGRSGDPVGRLANKQRHREQFALRPGASGGIVCSKSQSGQATNAADMRESKACSGLKGEWPSTSCTRRPDGIRRPGSGYWT
jgi:hypothetical protein